MPESHRATQQFIKLHDTATVLPRLPKKVIRHIGLEDLPEVAASGTNGEVSQWMQSMESHAPRQPGIYIC
jgi:hypothetical protein